MTDNKKQTAAWEDVLNVKSYRQEDTSVMSDRKFICSARGKV